MVELASRPDANVAQLAREYSPQPVMENLPDSTL